MGGLRRMHRAPIAIAGCLFAALAPVLASSGQVVEASVAAAPATVVPAAPAIGAVGAAAAADTPLYDSIPDPLPGNVPSVGFQATQTAELGDRIRFAGTGRNLQSVTVTMSSWACQTGAWETGNCVSAPGATFTIRSRSRSPRWAEMAPSDPSLASVTNDVTVPYRPSSGLPTLRRQSGQWHDDSTDTCFNGYAFNATFDFGGLVVPEEVVYGVSFNTQTWGYAADRRGRSLHLAQRRPDDGRTVAGHRRRSGDVVRGGRLRPVFAAAPQEAGFGIAVRFDTVPAGPGTTIKLFPEADTFVSAGSPDTNFNSDGGGPRDYVDTYGGFTTSCVPYRRSGLRAAALRPRCHPGRRRDLGRPHRHHDAGRLRAGR